MPKPKLAKAPTPLAPFADELYNLEKLLEPWQQEHAGELRRIETLRKLFRDSCSTLPAAEGRTIEGSIGVVQIGPRGSQDIINFGKLRTLISQKALDEVASVTMKALKDNAVAPEVIAQVVESSQTGYRPLKIYAKAAA